MVDALGKEIVIGAVYGYSQRRNGIVHIVIGWAEKINKTTVTLEIIKKAQAAYTDNPKQVPYDKPTVSVNSNTIFRLMDYSDKWEMFN